MDDESRNPSYREFMRARRPQLFSDTLHVEVGEMDRRQFEFTCIRSQAERKRPRSRTSRGCWLKRSFART